MAPTWPRRCASWGLDGLTASRSPARQSEDLWLAIGGELLGDRARLGAQDSEWLSQAQTPGWWRANRGWAHRGRGGSASSIPFREAAGSAQFFDYGLLQLADLGGAEAVRHSDGGVGDSLRHIGFQFRFGDG